MNNSKREFAGEYPGRKRAEFESGTAPPKLSETYFGFDSVVAVIRADLIGDSRCDQLVESEREGLYRGGFQLSNAEHCIGRGERPALVQAGWRVVVSAKQIDFGSKDLIQPDAISAERRRIGEGRIELCQPRTEFCSVRDRVSVQIGKNAKAHG